MYSLAPRYVRSSLQQSSTSAPAPLPTDPSADISQDVPEIGGSEAGFIGLVVALAALVVICCIGVFVLLRNHNPTSYERQMRRARRLQKRPTTSYYGGDGTVGLPGFMSKVGRLFGRKHADGWVRAADDEEWDAADFQQQLKVDSAYHPERHDDAHSAMSAVSGRGRIVADESAESVNLEAVPSEPSFSPRHSAEAEEHEDSQLEGERHERKQSDDSRFSVQMRKQGVDETSIRSMRKFESGTKFREGLEV